MNKRGYALSSKTTDLPAQSADLIETWFAIETRYRFERKVAERLSQKGLNVFLPLRQEHRVWSDRTKNLMVPLFPGYAFVRSDRSIARKLAVLQTAGVMGFVSFGGSAATVPQKQIEDLQLLLAGTAPFSLYPFLKVGRRVRVRGGCLDGIEGLLTQCEKDKLVISIDSIQRSLAVEINGYELELM
jgi:transcriptional antiterminator NusG